MPSVFLLLFEYIDLALRTFIAVTTILFAMESVTYPVTQERKRKNKRGRDMGGERQRRRRGDDMESTSRKARKTNGLLTPQASFVDTEEIEADERSSKRSSKRGSPTKTRYSAPTTSSAERDADELSRDIEQLERKETKLLQELETVRKGLKALKSLFISSATLEESSEVEDVAEEGRRTPVQVSTPRTGRSKRGTSDEEGHGENSQDTVIAASDNECAYEIEVEADAEAEAESDAQTESACESDSTSTTSSGFPTKKTQMVTTSTIQTSSRSEVSAQRTPRTLNRIVTPAPSLEIPPVGPPVDRNPSNYFVFFDLETTNAGIAYPNIRILEVALCVTDKNFTPLDDGRQFLVHWKKVVNGVEMWMDRDDILRGMPQKVREMHETSGLFRDYFATPPNRRLTLSQVEFRVINYLRSHDITQYGIMAGAGVGFDRGMVNCHMTRLDRVLYYQTFDTTTLWHFVKRRYNRSKRFSSSCLHRAMDDISGSIHEARTYADLLFKHPRDVTWPSPDGI